MKKVLPVQMYHAYSVFTLPKMQKSLKKICVEKWVISFNKLVVFLCLCIIFSNFCLNFVNLLSG